MRARALHQGARHADLLVQDVVFLACCHSDSLGHKRARAKESRRSSGEVFLNILWLGLKELRSLSSDLVMVLFVVYSFTGTIYVQATGTSSEVNNASIAFVDEDGSALSKELINAFYPPRFQRLSYFRFRSRDRDGQGPVHVRRRHSAAIRG